MMSPLKTCSFKCLLNMIRHSRTEQVDYVLCLVHFKNWTSQNSLQKLHFGSIKKEWNQTEQNVLLLSVSLANTTLATMYMLKYSIQEHPTTPIIMLIIRILKTNSRKNCLCRKDINFEKISYLMHYWNGLSWIKNIYNVLKENPLTRKFSQECT